MLVVREWPHVRRQSLACVQDGGRTGSLTYPGPRLRRKALGLAGTPRRTPPAGDSALRGPRPPSSTAGPRTAAVDRAGEGSTAVPAARRNSTVGTLPALGVGLARQVRELWRRFSPHGL